MEDPRIERLISDPEWIRQVEESARKWDRQMAAIHEGDEAAIAEFRADLVNVAELRRRYDW
jgi:hypothetical protein